MMNSVVHFEIPFDDAERAHKFYANTFGWLMTQAPGEIPYTMAQTGEVDSKYMPKKPGFINGGMMKRQKDITHPVITIGVENMADSLKKVANNGGKVLVKPQKVGDMGISSYILDTENNIIGLWQPTRPM